MDAHSSLSLSRTVALVGLMGAGKSAIGKRLAIGWTMGALVTTLGVLLSFKLDLPTDATIVCTHLKKACLTRRGRRPR